MRRKFFRHPIKESIKNSLLSLKSKIRYFLNIKNGYFAQPPEDYSIIWEDHFNDETLSNMWVLGQPWGDFHEGNLTQYYDTLGDLSYVGQEGLILELRHRPKKFTKNQLPEWRRRKDLPEEFIIPYGIGLVSSRQSWKYGWFEAEIKIPNGRHLWPAFWLTGKYTWPPEIDIFEGYSTDKSSYVKSGFSNWAIQPNLHYGSVKHNTKKMYGPYNCPIIDAQNRFVKYSCWWEKDFIRIYYDGFLVFETTNSEILSHFNGNRDLMYIVLNTGVNQKLNGSPTESCMIIRSVKVYQKKNETTSGTSGIKGINFN